MKLEPANAGMKAPSFTLMVVIPVRSALRLRRRLGLYKRGLLQRSLRKVMWRHACVITLVELVSGLTECR